MSNDEKSPENIQKKYIFTVKYDGDELDSYVDQFGKELAVFGPVSNVNIFVGATNSGKSRLMRWLMRNHPYRFFTFKSTQLHINEALKVLEGIENPTKQFGVTIDVSKHDFHIEEIDNLELADILSSLPPQKTATPTRTSLLVIQNHLESLLVKPDTHFDHKFQKLKTNSLPLRLILLSTENDKKWLEDIDEAFFANQKEELTKVADFIDTLLQHSLEDDIINPPQLVYIPVLRTAMTLGKISPRSQNEIDPISTSIGQNYRLTLPETNHNNTDAQRYKNMEVFTGNRLYRIVDEEKHGNSDIFKRLKDFERFLSNHFFEGNDVELRPLGKHSSHGSRLALTINWVDRPIKDLGEGIQAIIILMYRLYTAEKGSWIFIEEPEQGLHPGLQRIFLDRIANDEVIKANDLTIFFTTHSNHLLSIALNELEDISVFSFQREEKPNERFHVRPIFTHDGDIVKCCGSLVEGSLHKCI